MKKTIALLALSAMFCAAYADTYVKGYTRKDGTYVQPHMRSAPDGNPHNNYSAQGNVNPYTGKAGTVDPYNQQQQSCYVDGYGNRVCR
ncbi:MAG: hypothetical protein E6Q97_12635 [Desulfurellales bacterium]|nr:MAG: hypothetical protein E6Q97_12635 [Desulfurellales bacterium]